MSTLELPQPYLLFLGEVDDPSFAKTGFGLADWARERCVGELAFGSGRITTGLPRLTAAEAVAQGAKSVVIGVAPVGGSIAPDWVAALIEALEAGLDIVSGMHGRLGDHPDLGPAAQRLGRRLIDVRVPPRGLPVGTGLKRSGKRLLTVGTDCALGKKYTALAIAKAFNARGVAADFRATGQTGILIAGAGIPMDAVISDFASGAAELISPAAADDHWDVVEGQGSIYHPGYAGVTLALLHGSQPDVIVLCHKPDRTTILGRPEFPLPPLKDAIALYLQLARLTNPDVRCAGISLNTGDLDEAGAAAAIAAVTAETGLPAADPIRGGAAFDRLVDNCLTLDTVI